MSPAKHWGGAAFNNVYTICLHCTLMGRYVKLEIKK